MIQNSWVSSLEASQHLGVSEKTLSLWREIGYLQPGTHWRSSPEAQLNPWSPEVIYHLRWCKEKMEYWKNHGANILENAA